MTEPIYNEDHPTVIRVNEKTGIDIETIVEVLNASFEVYTEEIHETLSFD